MNLNGKILISFSGGRTSAFMTYEILRKASNDADIRIVFANTGEEHEETLKFVDRCQNLFQREVIWLEAQVHDGRGVGTTHRLVSFGTATRRGTINGPFECTVAKYGVTNRVFPSCTREMKERPIASYIREIGWRRGDYSMAIGIRADEMDRMSPSAERLGIIYPLVKWGVKKDDVLRFWRSQAFDLYIPEHFGNCVWCWKKSDRKLLTLARHKPDFFETPARLEEKYPHAGPGNTGEPRRFFRGKRTVPDLMREASERKFEEFLDGNEAFDPELDVGGGCEESCEAFASHEDYDELLELLG